MRDGVPASRCGLLSSFALAGVLGSLMISVAQAQSPAAPMLNRDDGPRSQFAGAGMRRVQSYGQPIGGAPGAAGGGPVAPLPGTAAPAGAGQLPTRVYKDVPLTGVYLNGVNVVGLRSQTLKGVNVRFDEQGNVLIDAPQYDIQLDSSFHPLLPSEIPARAKEAAPWPGDNRSSVKPPPAVSPAPADPLTPP